MDRHQLKCKGLTKTYGEFKFGPVDLAFSAGEITGVFGPNGAGKTTLISLLMGLIKNDSGTISRIGADFSSGVFDQTLLLPQTKVSGQLAALARAVNLSDSQRDALVDECGLRPYMNHRIAKLSTGNKQRVCLALALIQDPDIYIFDEPLNGLDPDGIEWFNEKIKDLARRGKIVIVATHLLAEAESVVDRCVFLKHGQIIYQGTVRELSESIKNQRAYKYVSLDFRHEIPHHLKTVYSDKYISVIYDPECLTEVGTTLDRYLQEHRLPLSALYRIKSHEVEILGGER